MRIAMIGSRGVPAASGGIERTVEMLGAALVARGHAVTVFCRSNYLEDPPASHEGMRLRVLPTIGTKHLDAIVHTALSTATALRGFDVLHYHAIGPGLLTPAAKALARRAAVVQTVHALDYQRSKWGSAARLVLQLGERVAGHSRHEVIVPSAGLADHFRARYGKEVALIPQPFPTVEHVPPRTIGERFGLEPARYLIFVGRLTPEKQVDLLLRAYRSVQTECPLVVVGGSSHTDDHAAELADLARRDPRVIMTGPVHGPLLDELLTNAAAFVSPSALEGMPITLLEAISAEIPIVASSIPPHVELLGAMNGASRLHDPASEASLADAISDMLEHREEARRAVARQRARLLAETSGERVAELTEGVYERAIARRLRR